MSKRWNVRLNLWMRLAIVLTVFWMFGATLAITIKEATKADDAASSTFYLCQDSQRMPADSGAAFMWKGMDCLKERERIRGYYSPWIQGVSFAGIYAVLAWIFGGILYGSTRWILAGRKSSDA